MRAVFSDMPFEYDGEKAEPEGDTSEMATLNDNHTHYICVDNHTTGRFGTEVTFRAELETFISFYDYDARGMKNVSTLTDYFAHCMDKSTLAIGGHVCEAGVSSHMVRLMDERTFEGSRRPTEIEIVRTASDGSTKQTYALSVLKVDPKELETPARSLAAAEESGNREKRERSEKIKFTALSNLASPFTLDGKDVEDISLSAGEIAFDKATAAYEVKVPLSCSSLRVTVQLRSAEKRAIQAVVPVVTLCYGGGPAGSLKTLLSAGPKPIIVVRGSLRTAQFIEDWLQFDSRKDQNRKDPDELRAIAQQQNEHATRSLREDMAMAQRPPMTYEEAEGLAETPPWWDVQDYVLMLEKLSLHETLYFFDINQKTDQKTNKKIRLNPMLPPLLESIVKSTEVKDSVKLPLAIRLNDANDVKTLCDRRPLAFERKDIEITKDGRALVFAAFNDQGKVVERMLDAGFDIAQLDHLIALELQCTLNEHRLVKQNTPP